ncbi:hypothetical protein KFU94_09110 [Chloroflexi bacterium TSY]|nr:hypothetical protein [Chloroflexi bacterium TSY]
MNNAQRINQTSGKTEYYTPAEIVDAARSVMGGIDLDPASSAAANERVQALHFFNKADNGLSQRWFGRVWLNHPFGDPEKPCKKRCPKKRCDPSFADKEKKPDKWRGYCIREYHPGNPDWIDKLVNEYTLGRIEQACCITFASTSEKWFQPLFNYPQCYLSPRTDYFLPNGTKKKGVTKGSVVTYFGSDLKRFDRIFGKLGRVTIPAKMLLEKHHDPR